MEWGAAPDYMYARVVPHDAVGDAVDETGVQGSIGDQAGPARSMVGIWAN